MDKINPITNSTERTTEVEDRIELIDKYESIKEQYFNTEKMLLRVFDEQEKHKKQVSDELYNVIGQTLYGSLIGLKMALKANIDDSLKEYLTGVIETTNDVLHQVRKLSFELFPLAVEDIGFIEALKSYIRTIDNDNTPIQLIVRGTRIRYELEKEMLFYRICQQTLSLLVEVLYAANLILTITFDELSRGILKFQFQFNEGETGVTNDLLKEGLAIIHKKIETWSGEMNIYNNSNEFRKWTIEVRVP
ncbi:sensor histidine kinase [Calidifontibacillus oryziterrae]|uniref:hypothetical protein n=1 Tax=Calidifontibacillus oryziterrae TaxID=1191699 RepID=UPI0002F9B823|nr:hypothetical protein [Calidifontibacillus oryziterrae]